MITHALDHPPAPGGPVADPDGQTAAVYERSVLDPERPFSDRLAITQTGREVLQGVTDWLSLQPPLRWLGGVRIDPSTPTWRWDEARQDVTMA